MNSRNRGRLVNDEKSDDENDDIDHAEFCLPSGRFSITGARNGKLSLCIGIAIVVMAFGLAIANILDSIYK